jgi:hypothetical protein
MEDAREPERQSAPGPLRSRLAGIRVSATEWAQTERGRRALTWLRRVVNVVIIGAIALQLSQIGWREVVAALPTNPWFYILIVVGYFTLPVAEMTIYGRLWGVSPRQSLSALLKKRIYNLFIVEYSGEVFLYWWARRQTGRSRGEVARDVRDVNILSNAASVIVAVLLIGGLLASGWLDPEELVGRTTPVYLIGGAFLLALVIALALRFRSHLFSLSSRLALLVLGLHLTQVVAINAIKLTQWTIGVPEITLGTWLIFLAMAVALERLPLIPSKDFVFVGASVELARTMEVGAAAVASVLLVATLGGQLMHLLTYLVVTITDRRTNPPETLQRERT